MIEDGLREFLCACGEVHGWRRRILRCKIREEANSGLDPATDYGCLSTEVGDGCYSFIHGCVFLGEPVQPRPKGHALCDSVQILGPSEEEPPDSNRANGGTSTKWGGVPGWEECTWPQVWACIFCQWE